MSKINYDPEGDVLSWELNSLPIDDSIVYGDLIIEVSPDRVPVYITLLNARKIFNFMDTSLSKKPSAIL